jgi:hypothetical protein
VTEWVEVTFTVQVDPGDEVRNALAGNCPVCWELPDEAAEIKACAGCGKLCCDACRYFDPNSGFFLRCTECAAKSQKRAEARRVQ